MTTNAIPSLGYPLVVKHGNGKNSPLYNLYVEDFHMKTSNYSSGISLTICGPATFCSSGPVAAAKASAFFSCSCGPCDPSHGFDTRYPFPQLQLVSTA